VLVALILIGAVRKWHVPGWLYEQERADSAILRDQGDRNSKALETIVRLVKAQTLELAELRKLVKTLHDQRNGGPDAGD
jgi:hypothetical protein